MRNACLAGGLKADAFQTAAFKILCSCSLHQQKTTVNYKRKNIQA
jgi:hypothetical protein